VLCLFYCLALLLHRWGRFVFLLSFNPFWGCGFGKTVILPPETCILAAAPVPEPGGTSDESLSIAIVDDDNTSSSSSKST
jgi:hypothetical protein